MSFTELNLHAQLLRAVNDLGFTKATPIQIDAIPPALAGRDVLACAQTGSGKTAAFLLPILHRLLESPKRGVTRALVLTPTRELAAQIHEDFQTFAKHTTLRSAAVYGGVGMGPQEHAFKSGVDLIVATPGRLLDHFRLPYARLAGLEYLVLDEADRMLDMGFLPDIRRVLRHIPAQRQTMFFSATMPQPIAVLASEMLKTPARINIERQSQPATGITQALYPVTQDVKAALLCELLSRGILQEVLVFTRTKHRANRLAEHLLKKGMNATRIHGNRSQAQRTEALQGFKSGKYRVLVATDIAARGIDVEALSHVVNFDVPAAPEDYIHRVGRTGRAEMTGEAFTMVAPDEEPDVRAIERAIGRTLPRVTLPDFEYKARAEALEVPRAERIAAIRARRAQERQRSQSRAAGSTRPQAAHGTRPQSAHGNRPPSFGNRPPSHGNRPAASHGNRSAAGPGGRGPSSHGRPPSRSGGTGPSRGVRG